MYCSYGQQFLPRRQTELSAGYDFYSPVDIECRAGEVYQIDTGVHIQEGDLHDNAVMLLFPRSSWGFKYGFQFLNTTGVIDSDYRDSIQCRFRVDKDMRIRIGDRFMQGVIVRYDRIPNEIPPQRKREGGIGSTDAVVNYS